MPTSSPHDAPVVVYGSSQISPYPATLAALLSRVSSSVTLVTNTDVPNAGPGFRVRKWWTVTGSFLGTVVRRGLAPLRTAQLARRTQATLVVAFGDEWADLVFGCAARLGVRVVFVAHNAGTDRRYSGADHASERWLVKRSSVVVHEPTQLAAVAGRSGRTVAVARHPALQSAVPGARRDRSLLFLGVPRSDKGAAELPELARQLAQQDPTIRLRVVGKGDPTQLGELPSNVDLEVDPAGVPEQVVQQALATSGVLVAPYVQTTASATVLTALGAGLGVVAYDAPSLRRVLPASSLVPPGDLTELLARALGYLSDPWPMDYDASAWDESAITEWTKALS